MYSTGFIAAAREFSEYGVHIPAPYLRKSFVEFQDELNIISKDVLLLKQSILFVVLL